MLDIHHGDAVWLTILFAALITYILRLSGLLLAGWLPKTGRFKRFMDALPGTILLSLIIPAAISAGPAGWIATALTGLCSLKTGNIFFSMVVGIAIIGGARFLGIAS